MQHYRNVIEKKETEESNISPQRKKCPYSGIFWSVFSRTWAEYGEIRSISPYAVRMQENTDHKKSEYGHFSWSVYFLSFSFYLGFLSRTFKIHRTAGKWVGYLFNFSLPLPPTLQALRRQPGNYCRELTSAHSQQPYSNREPLVSERKLLTTKLCAVKIGPQIGSPVSWLIC